MNRTITLELSERQWAWLEAERAAMDAFARGHEAQAGIPAVEGTIESVAFTVLVTALLDRKVERAQRAERREVER